MHPVQWSGPVCMAAQPRHYTEASGQANKQELKQHPSPASWATRLQQTGRRDRLPSTSGTNLPKLVPRGSVLPQLAPLSNFHNACNTWITTDECIHGRQCLVTGVWLRLSSYGGQLSINPQEQASRYEQIQVKEHLQLDQCFSTCILYHCKKWFGFCSSDTKIISNRRNHLKMRLHHN